MFGFNKARYIFVIKGPGSLWKGLERVMGIEPTWPAWKAGALPLSYTRSRRYSSFHR